MRLVSLTSWRENISHLEKWFDSRIGRQFLVQQLMLVESKVTTLFGYHLLEMSVDPRVSFSASSKIKHCFAMSPLADSEGMVLGSEQLPFAEESIDVAIVQHVLESSEQPHLLLKELSRVVLPSGYLVVIGFNPYSVIGLRSIYQRIRKQGAWQNPFISAKRLSDYLCLLDFSVESIEYGYYPCSSQQQKSQFVAAVVKKLEKWQWPLGGFYVLVAKKQVSRLTPLRVQKIAKVGKISLLNPALYQQSQNNRESDTCQKQP